MEGRGGMGGNHSPFQMWPCAKLGRRRAVIWEGGGLWGWKVTAWTHIEWRRVDLLCAHDNEGESMTWWNTWLWGRCGNTIWSQRQLDTGRKNKLWELRWKGRWGRNQGQTRTAICERQLMCEVLYPAVALSIYCCVWGHLGPPRAT